jgi:hypothetical protein
MRKLVREEKQKGHVVEEKREKRKENFWLFFLWNFAKMIGESNELTL